MDKEEIKITITDKINSFLKNYIIDVTITAVLIAYLLTSIATLKITVVKTLPIIADLVLMLLIGAMLKTLFGRKGVMMGEKNKEFIAIKKQFENVVENIKPKLEGLDEFCSRKNEERLQRVQNLILLRVGLTLDMLDSGITPKPEQMGAYKHAMNVKVENLNSIDLISEQTRKKEDFTLGRSKASFMRSRNIGDFISSLLFCIIFSTFTLEIAQDFNWSSLIWSILQLVYFILKGSLSLLRSYEFITVEYSNRIMRKTNLLIEYDNTTDMEDILAAREQKKAKLIEEENSRTLAEEKVKVEEQLLLAATEEKEKLENERKGLEAKNAILIEQLELLRSKEIAQSMSDMQYEAEAMTESLSYQDSTNQTESIQMTELANNEDNQNNEIINENITEDTDNE